MARILYVSIKQPYGKIIITPECETSRKFAQLLKQRTFTEMDVQLIKNLGFEFKTKEVKL